MANQIKIGLLITLGFVLALGVGVVVARLPPAPPPVEVRSPPTVAPGDVKVYVSGAVVQPGVYTLAPAARVEDAIAAAGGPGPEADLDAINLALRVRDEYHVHVPRRGESPPAAAASRPPDGPAAGSVNLNRATAADLEALPGIGPTLARRIVEHRTRNGPFKSPQELRDFRLVPASTYERIKDKLTVE